MIANYHAHTARCGHAAGEDRDYVESALRAGLRLLGFSDHAPQRYPDGSTGRRGIRMPPEQLASYAASVRSLAEEYRGRIAVRLGVEAEYYPGCFRGLLSMLRGEGVEYMLLGQHFLGDEIGEPYSGRPTEDEAILRRYVDQCCEGLETGLFSAFAHPDLLRFCGPEAVYEREMRRLCRRAAETDTPLEINLLGIREGRHYPDERFWRIAAQEGNEVLLGCDAHSPGELCDRESERTALRLAARLGIRPLRELPGEKLRRLG